MQSLHEPNRNFKQLISLVLVLAFWTNVVCAAGGPTPARAAKSKRDAAEKSSGVVDVLREQIASDARKSGAADKSAGAQSRARPGVSEIGNELPLRFEMNEGQTDAAVKFLARAKGYNLFLTQTEAVMVVGGRGAGAQSAPARARESKDVRGTKESVVRMRLKDSNPRAAAEGLEELSGRSNYLIGNEPDKWQIGVKSFEKVRYAQVYPGVDAVYYGNQGRLEHDFHIAAGADPRLIKLEYEGAKSLRVDGNGDLILEVEGGEVRQSRPVAYQEVDGRRREVASRYVVKGRQVGFAVGAYDATRELVIDPILVYSTYLGGAGSDGANAVTLDSAGNIYVTGYTASANFPTVNPRQSTNMGANDVFVTKLNPSGSAILYSTYLGGTVNRRVSGSGDDNGRGIAVDSAGNAYVVGWTSSTDYPVAGTLRATYGGGTYDGFISKLSAAGNTLVYSAYLGGSLEDQAAGVALDSAGNAYVTGYTVSTNFPVAAALRPTNAGGAYDAFISKVNAAGTAFVYSTYLGGDGGDKGNAITLDSAGNVYVTGSTNSSNFPTLNAFQPFDSGPEDTGFGTTLSTDAFVTKLNAAGNALVYSTYLGGNYAYPDYFGGYNLNFATDSGSAIAVDSAGSAYVAGGTASLNFPTTSAFQPSMQGTSAAFVTKFTPSGSGLVYSTYLGGSDNGTTSAYGIAVDSTGNAHVVGETLSSSFPTANALQSQLRDVNGTDAFVTKFTPSGSGLVYSTYLGGTGSDHAHGVTLDANGNAYVVGYTGSQDFPTASPKQPASGGADDAFILKVADAVGYTVSGRVTAADGSPLNGVSVVLSGSMSATAVTSGNGNYTFANLAGAGNYTVAPSLPPYTFDPPSRTFNNLSADQTADFAIQTYTITGRVTDAAGNGVGGVTISIGGTQSATGTTGADGRYSFINFAQGGSYTVTPSKSDILLTYSFSPTGYSYTNLGANQTADFVATASLVNALYPVADAYVQDGTNAGVNFGTATPLKVQTGTKTNSGTNMDAYLRFDLSGVGQNVSSAKLRVYASLSAAGSVSTSVYPVSDTSWVESGTGSINWNNRPARGATAIAGASATVAGTTAATFDIDVTSYVKSEKSAGRDLVSLALHNPATSSVFINVSSREDAANKPQLIVAASDGGNNPPAVTLTSPANGATFGSPVSITLSANATDDGSISRVDFYAGTSLVGTTTTPASGSTYSFTWTGVPAGSYSLYAVATDNSGLATTSNASGVTVGLQNSPPSVTLTSPLNGTTFGAGANIALNAQAADTDGSVSKVEFYAGANLVGTATTPVNGVYSVTWAGVNTGAYTLTAKATDNSNATTTSAAVNINVVAAAGLSPTADAYVRDGTSATTNFGTATTLQTQVSATTGNNRETYLKFDLTTASGITRAKLRLYGSLSDATGSNVPAAVYSVATTTWVESGSGSITWNTKPASGATPLATATVKDNTARWYEWDVTSYLQSEKAAGRNVVSLAVKNTSQSSPFASFNSREATTNQPQLILWSTQPRNALLVVGSTTLNTGDSAVKTRLQNLGYTVTVKAAGSTSNTAIKTSDADGKTLVVISSTVTPANVANKFRNVAVPVLDWEFDILDDMGMTGLTSGTDFGTTSTAQTQLSIADPTQPMAAGLSGTQTVVTTATNFTWGKPNLNAVKVATVAGDATKVDIFGYDAGAAMPGLEAPARRVALFLTDTTAAGFNANGGALFDAAVKWAADLNTAPTINTLTPASGPTGTTVTISGLNFGSTQGTSTLTFNGLAATPNSWSDKTVVAAVPAYALTGPVVITVSGVASNGVTFTVGDVDSDGDGLPDWWEMQYFGNLSQTAGVDPDGDGYTNLQEYQRGMNPTKAELPDTNNAVNLKVHTPLQPQP
jgi:Bacterial Ig domain/Beta-propeller repeat/Carboxypeptidase regulatory-like domain/IPT/TIG domain/Bacterial TSP3 repeat